ncbi:hypothetical protein QFZ24_005618 [Streptomyces phaeochromogenes]|jgi:hypothetical protein|uniref:DUF3558 domain-containing protein n=1 Tax=Streptomyces phaeochromogenes TaxID=1923 RepID=UPI00278CF319|nr:DUF3558 domain-containing protein [Streptomyces phaeochromogenes]MDQ0951695.1 hypothetical protein [Streptomyces phaeochromogenes]
MHRPAQRQRLTRILVGAAAVPMMLVASGCSSDSGDGSGDDAKKDSGASASSSATEAGSVVKEAAYAKLPEPCKVFSSKTLKEMVPKGTKSNKEGKSGDTQTRGNCSWNSLDNNGVDGSQFRWLNVSLLRFESDATRGTGEKLASEYFTKHAEDARSVTDAKNTKSQPLTGMGNEATLVTYDLKKKEGTFKQQTVVTRVENVVVTVDYNGAGLAGDKAPKVADLTKAAEKAAKEAVEAVRTANGAGGSAAGSSTAPSKSPSPSKSASKSAGQGADLGKDSGTSKSPSKSTTKKD